MASRRALAVAVALGTLPRALIAKKKKIHPAAVSWHAPFFAGGGYCSEATAFALALDKSHVHISIEHHGDTQDGDYVQGLPQETLRALMKMHARGPKGPIEVAVCHSEPGAWHVLDGPAWPSSPCPKTGRDGHGPSYVVGRTMFETDRLPDGWPARLNAVDEVWVPTAFHKDVFERAGVRDVFVVAEPVDTTFFNPNGPRYAIEGVAEDAFVVASVFKWEKRKGWDVLLRAWHQARLPGSALVLVTNAYHTEDDFDAKIDAFVKEELGDPAGRSALGNVVILSKLKDAELAALYRRADLVALPTRGEGWGRPHVEAMASGAAVAATAWSGPTAYLDDTNGFPLRWSGPVLVGEGPFENHKWAEPDADHLAEVMERARLDPGLCDRLGAKARKDMVSKYSPEVLAKEVALHLDRIHDTIEGRYAEKGRRRKKMAHGGEL